MLFVSFCVSSFVQGKRRRAVTMAGISTQFFRRSRPDLAKGRSEEYVRDTSCLRDQLPRQQQQGQHSHMPEVAPQGLQQRKLVQQQGHGPKGMAPMLVVAGAGKGLQAVPQAQRLKSQPEPPHVRVHKCLLQYQQEQQQQEEQLPEQRQQQTDRDHQQADGQQQQQQQRELPNPQEQQQQQQQRVAQEEPSQLPQQQHEQLMTGQQDQANQQVNVQQELGDRQQQAKHLHEAQQQEDEEAKPKHQQQELQHEKLLGTPLGNAHVPAAAAPTAAAAAAVAGLPAPVGALCAAEAAGNAAPPAAAAKPPEVAAAVETPAAPAGVKPVAVAGVGALAAPADAVGGRGAAAADGSDGLIQQSYMLPETEDVNEAVAQLLEMFRESKVCTAAAAVSYLSYLCAVTQLLNSQQRR